MKNGFVCKLLVFGAMVACPVIAAQQTQPEAQPATQPDAAEEVQRDRDPKADAVAERVMKRLGGTEAWNNTHYIQWTFFGARSHTWDTRRMVNRMQYTDGDGVQHTIVIDLNTKTGSAWRDDVAIENADELVKLMDRAHSAWINDSYWLVMPYKLLDPGVHLRHLGERKLEDGTNTKALELTFEDDIGRTPYNKYHVYVDRESDLVVQWDYYERSEQRAPSFTSVWAEWKQYGNIWLSGDRGILRERPAKLTDIAVHDELPGWMFSHPFDPKETK